MLDNNMLDVTVSMVCITGILVFFFFQAEDGIRDVLVTGVQTCALPVSEEIEAIVEGICL